MGIAGRENVCKIWGTRKCPRSDFFKSAENAKETARTRAKSQEIRGGAKYSQTD